MLPVQGGFTVSRQGWSVSIAETFWSIQTTIAWAAMNFLIGSIARQHWVKWTFALVATETLFVPHRALSKLLFSCKNGSTTTRTACSVRWLDCCGAWNNERTILCDIVFTEIQTKVRVQSIKLKSDEATFGHQFEESLSHMQNHSHVGPTSCRSKFYNKHPYRVHRKQWSSQVSFYSHCTWSIFYAILVPLTTSFQQQKRLRHNEGSLHLRELWLKQCQRPLFLERVFRFEKKLLGKRTIEKSRTKRTYQAYVPLPFKIFSVTH